MTDNSATLLYEVTEETVKHFLYEGVLIDGRAGGLIIGRSHAAGGIHTIVKHGPKTFSLVELEGWEYLVNPYAAATHRARIEKINSFLGDYPPLSQITMSRTTRMLNTSAEPNDRLLLIDFGSYAINPRATSKHFAELEQLNCSVNTYNSFDYKFPSS